MYKSANTSLTKFSKFTAILSKKYLATLIFISFSRLSWSLFLFRVLLNKSITCMYFLFERTPVHFLYCLVSLSPSIRFWIYASKDSFWNSNKNLNVLLERNIKGSVSSVEHHSFFDGRKYLRVCIWHWQSFGPWSSAKGTVLLTSLDILFLLWHCSEVFEGGLLSTTSCTSFCTQSRLSMSNNDIWYPLTG